MLNLNAAPFTKENYQELTDHGHYFLRDLSATLESNEMTFARVSVNYSGNFEAIENAILDLKDFYKYSLKEKFSGKKVFLSINISPNNNPKNEYTLNISKAGVTILANTPNAAARAIYRLQAQLRLRRAPFLTIGKYSSKKDLYPAIAHLAFRSYSTIDADFPEAYHKNYLKRLARALYTGFHVNLSLSMFVNSKLIPEFNNQNSEQNLKILNQIVERANKFGLKVYVSLYLSAIQSDHPAFIKYPDIRGSRLVGSDNLHVCCSSNELVRNYYAEQCSMLFSKVPMLDGLILISGCEGFLHCHTACDQTADGKCNCPTCQNTEPEKSVAQMFNIISNKVKQTNPNANLIIWNYGLHAWTNKEGEKFISYLNENCDIMVNFDTGDDFTLAGAQGTRFDYSLSCVGPSKVFNSQKKFAQAKFRNILAKCENGPALEYCSLQYIPALTRWNRKYQNIIKSNCNGALFNWKFIGYTEGLAQELAGLVSTGEQKNILARLATQHFGKDNLLKLMDAWKCFDKAMDFHPFSIGSAGYFKGPFFIGPAQLLFLTVDVPNNIPDAFYWANRKGPLFMNTLSFVEPFGVKAFQKAIAKVQKHWKEGINILKTLNLHQEDNYLYQEIQNHLNLCNLFYCFIKTASNMTDFYALRDSFQQESYSPIEAKNKLSLMKQIAEQELINTQNAIDILQNNHRIAFSYTYHYGISIEMCKYKIEHTKNLINKELPRRLYGITFTRNRHPQWHI